MCGRTGNVCISRDIRNKMDIKKHGMLTKRIKKINCQPCKNNRLTIKRGYVMLAISSASVSVNASASIHTFAFHAVPEACPDKLK